MCSGKLIGWMEDKWWAFGSRRRVPQSPSRWEHFLGESLGGKAGWLLRGRLALPGPGLQAPCCPDDLGMRFSRFLSAAPSGKYVLFSLLFPSLAPLPKVEQSSPPCGQPQESSAGWGGQRVTRLPVHGSEVERDCVGRTVFRILQQPLFNVFN